MRETTQEGEEEEEEQKSAQRVQAAQRQMGWKKTNPE
jgi:hypothetical protein